LIHPSSFGHYQLTHDYLVPSLRNWLTRKQREPRRGRAELLLAERAMLWNAKPENRHLPSGLEWANIRLLTKRKDWTEQERRMMKRARRVHGSRGLGLAALIAMVAWAGIEGFGGLRAFALVKCLRTAGTADVPAIVNQIAGYRRWAYKPLMRLVQDSDEQSRDRLHASLALLPVDTTQVDYLSKRLMSAAPSALPVFIDALNSHRLILVPRLWTALNVAKPGDAALLPCAGALAVYDPDSALWEAAGGKVAQALVTVNSLVLGSWLDALRPVRGRLTAPLAAIFWDKDRSETVRSLATDILVDYASDDPDLLAELVMLSVPKAFAKFFPVAERQVTRNLPLFQGELARKAAYSWNDQPLDPN
jgi:eukaryotic-like serine/threonine-protein kinase